MSHRPRTSLLFAALTLSLAACGAPDAFDTTVDDAVASDDAALQNAAGHYVASSQTFRSGRITSGSLASTQVADGIALKMSETVPTYGGGLYDDWLKLESTWTLANVPAGNYTLRIIARKASTASIETFSFAWQDTAFVYPRWDACKFNTTAFTTCDVPVTLGCTIEFSGQPCCGGEGRPCVSAGVGAPLGG